MTTLQRPGTSISITEITNISTYGIWLFSDDREYFLPYTSFPWFKNKRINEVLNVTKLSDTHYYWPDLDIDLTTDMIEHPDHYPMEYK